jgi:hypothetical protein
MVSLENKNVLVIGLGASGVAACTLLRERGANVVAVDSADTPRLRGAAAPLLANKVQVHLGASTLSSNGFDLAVVSPGVPWSNPILSRVSRSGVPIIGELELGFQQSYCLSVAITGTNGKTTTTELVERLLRNNQFKTTAAGTPVRLGDVGSVEPSIAPAYTIVTANQKPAVLLNINRQPDSNTLDVARAVHAQLADIQKTLPAGIMLRAYGADLEPRVLNAYNESFRDHWAHEDVSPVEWQAFAVGRSSFRPELSPIALEGDNVVGLSINRVSPQDFAPLVTSSTRPISSIIPVNILLTLYPSDMQ